MTLTISAISPMVLVRFAGACGPAGGGRRSLEMRFKIMHRKSQRASDSGLLASMDE
jgi:hypothetical protein